MEYPKSIIQLIEEYKDKGVRSIEYAIKRAYLQGMKDSLREQQEKELKKLMEAK